MGRQKGSILIIALWSVCFLAVFAVYLGYGVRQKILLVQRLQERSKLSYAADAGIKKAIIMLQKSVSDSYDTFNSLWSNDTASFKDISLGDCLYTVSYNYYDEARRVTVVRYGMVDEESKININKASRDVLRRLFKITTDMDDIEADHLAAAIIDWRDADSELTIPLGSAEDYDYQSLVDPYDAKDADFDVLEEVLLVKGMTPEIFESIKRYITIYGDGKVNINTASRSVLFALGLERDIVHKILMYRSGEDLVFGTFDDGVFTLPANIVPELSQFVELSESQIAKLTKVAEQSLVTKSRHFRIQSSAHMQRRRNVSKIICIVDRNGTVLYRQET